MTVVLSPALVVAPASGESSVNPYLGWRNVITRDTIAADSATPFGPATNLANSSTANRWQSASADEQLVTVSEIDGETDYVGIARHNLAGMAISVEAITAEPGAEWEEVHPGMVVADASAILLRFTAGLYIGVRLRIVPDAVAPSIAVLFVGLLTVVPTGIPPGYTPLTDGVDVDIVSGRSVNGEFLGAIVEGASLSSRTPIRLLPRDWYDAEMRPFVTHANNGGPFFFAWSPVLQPEHVAYCWASASIRPVISQTDNSYDVDLPMRGVA